MCVQRPNAQRHAQLAVVAQWAPVHSSGVRQKLGDPLLHRGFSVASSDGQDGSFEGVALLARQTLKGEHHILNHQDVRVVSPQFGAIESAYHKPSHSRTVRLQDKIMPVVPWPF